LCFARISRCITVVIACRDCLQLSERMSVRLCTTLVVSLALSWLYFVFFFAHSSSSPRIFCGLRSSRSRRRIDAAINMLILAFKRLLFQYPTRFFVVVFRTIENKRNADKRNRKLVQPKGLWKPLGEKKSSVIISRRFQKEKKGRKQETRKIENFLRRNFVCEKKSQKRVNQTSWSSPNFNL
jgi:hypothetical protein